MLRTRLILIGLLAIGLPVTRLAATQLADLEALRTETRYANTEMLYLPNGKALLALSIGYRNVLAHLLWFNTINYFGKHYHADKDYRWLQHSCDLVTQLDAKADYAYEFCGMMLAWEAKQGEEAVNILERAVKEFPESWRFRYYLGITVALFIGDDVRAQENFALGARLPSAPAFLGRLAAKHMAAAGDIDQAISFVGELIQNTTDQTQRNSYIDRYYELEHERNLRALEKAIEEYRQRAGRMPKSIAELINSGIVTSIGKDPYGGEYTLDPQSGKVDSSSHKARISRQITSPFAKKLREEKLAK